MPKCLYDLIGNVSLMANIALALKSNNSWIQSVETNVYQSENSDIVDNWDDGTDRAWPKCAKRRPDRLEQTKVFEATRISFEVKWAWFAKVINRIIELTPHSWMQRLEFCCKIALLLCQIRWVKWPKTGLIGHLRNKFYSFYSILHPVETHW